MNPPVLYLLFFRMRLTSFFTSVLMRVGQSCFEMSIPIPWSDVLINSYVMDFRVSFKILSGSFILYTLFGYYLGEEHPNLQVHGLISWWAN